jgi:uncharacterized SAM-binding protein YcdF (DUF218 family)
MEILRKLVNLLLPPDLIVLVLVAGLLLLRWAPRTGKTLLWSGSLALLLLSMPWVSNALIESTGTFQPFPLAEVDAKEVVRKSGAQAIVVLAGEPRSGTEYGGMTVGSHTLERLRLGAGIARRTGLPILVTGGRRPGDRESMATLMDRALRDEFGLGAQWLEDKSRNTHENAERSAAMLHAAGVNKVILVTHYWHMRRAQADFADFGIFTIAAPTNFPIPSYPNISAALVPRAHCLEESAMALHELLGQAGRIFGLHI